MFKKGSKIIYPRHGAGKITNKKKIKINGETEDYYILAFLDSPVIVSIPQKKAEELGLRKPLTPHKIKKILKKLGNTIEITEELLKNLDNISKDLLLSGNFEDAVYLFNLLTSLARKKERDNKNFSYSASEILENTKEFLLSEIKNVLGEKAFPRYSFLNQN
jgi:CarD family transcriptional regulator